MRFAVLPRRTLVARLLAGLLLLAGGARAAAQTNYTWNNPNTGQDWLTAGNWAPSGPPNAASAAAVFGGVSTGANAVTVSSGVTTGQISFTDVNQRSATAAYTVGG